MLGLNPGFVTSRQFHIPQTLQHCCLHQYRHLCRCFTARHPAQAQAIPSAKTISLGRRDPCSSQVKSRSSARHTPTRNLLRGRETYANVAQLVEKSLRTKRPWLLALTLRTVL